MGRYRLLQEIGHGGCGLVYLAEQEEPVRRRVALKLIKLGMDTRQVVARFDAERQAMALMDHPNIAKVLEAGATDTGRPYFVMELVGGVQITEHCDQNHLATHERLQLFIQVCRAIQHAHQKGVIHRDIKPSNVLVAIHDGRPTPKIIDFGIAKATQGRLTDHTLFTAFDQFLGTPAYMSPEQTQLGSLDVDTRTDIYSLGVLLYELLTGRTPFDARELVAAGWDEVRRTIRESEPDRPSVRLRRLTNLELTAAARDRRSDAPKLVHLVRGDLDWIVMKCLEKDRARRYETANGLAMDVERYLNHEPIVARPPSRWYEFRKTVRRHTFGFAATAAIMLVLAAAAMVSTWLAVRTKEAEREQFRLRAEALAARRDATEKLWDSYLAEARALRLTGRSGRRFDSLDALGKAAAIRPTPALRNEAIKCLALADVRWVGGIDLSQPRRMVGADPMSGRYAVSDLAGGVSIKRGKDDEEVGRLPSLGAPVSGGLAFSQDGRFLAGGYADARWRIWDWMEGRLAAEFPAPPGTAAAFFPDSRGIAFTDSTNILWVDLDRGGEVRRSTLGYQAAARTPGWLRFDPTGRRMALFRLESETNVVILDAKSGEIERVLAHDSFVFEPAWHPDGRQLAVVCADGTLHLWDATAGRHLRSWRTESNISVGFNHQGNILVSSGWDGQTRWWEFPGGRPLVSIGKSGHVLGFSPDDRRLTLSHWSGTGLEHLETASGQGLRTFRDNWEQKAATGGRAAFGPTGRLLAGETPEGIAVWDAASGREVATLAGEGVGIIGLIGFEADERGLILSGPKGLFRWALSDSPATASTAVILNSACADPAGGRTGGVSADGRICVTTGEDRCQIFRTDTFALLAETGPQKGMRFIAVSPDGALIASGAWHYPGVHVWNARTGALVRALPGDEQHADGSAIVEFTPDSQELVVSTPAEFCFWRIADWSLARRIPQAPGSDFAGRMAFSRDGRFFAGTHSRTVVRLYDAATGNTLADLETPDAGVITALSFNPDGTQLATSESRNALRVWDLRSIRDQLAEMGLDWEAPPYPAKRPVAVGTSPTGDR